MKKFIFLFIALTLFIIIFYNQYKNTQINNLNFKEFETAFVSTIKEKISSEDDLINLQQITDFNWDSVYIFGHYSTRIEIAKEIGIFPKFHLNNNNDQGSLFVFFLDDKIVLYGTMSELKGDFTLNEENLYEKNESNFQIRFLPNNHVINNELYQGWVYLIEPSGLKNWETIKDQH